MNVKCNSEIIYVDLLVIVLFYVIVIPFYKRYRFMRAGYIICVCVFRCGAELFS